MKSIRSLIFLIVASCASQHEVVRRPDCPMKPPVDAGRPRLVAFGDSQTAGTRSCIAGTAYSWADRVAKDKNLDLYNEAVGGSIFLSYEQLGRILDFQYRSSDTVILFLGYNDQTRYGLNGDVISEFKSTLYSTLVFLSPKVSRVVLITTGYTHDYFDYGTPAGVSAYAQSIHDVFNSSTPPNVSIIDPPILTSLEFYEEDHVHYSVQAQGAIGLAVEVLL